MGGVIACDKEWAGRLRQVRIATGGILHPFAAYQLHRGLQTPPIRVRAAQESAQEIARRLNNHSAISRVYYPGLAPSSWSGQLAKRQMKGPGAMIAVELKGGMNWAIRMMESVGLFTPAVSLGSTDSLIQHPAGLTHRIVDEEGQKEGGIGAGLIRFSIGLEHVEDLWSDLDQALEAAQNESTPLTSLSQAV